ncbi:MAG: glycosyl transferase [Prevotellaceae bacterium]|jgi:mannosyltransferase OCH1-like enzyme|nr:glycosyl transferase [Prevotellaceae bacterium]
MIPKIIHYCWLSDNPVPEKYQKFVDGWCRQLPDYEFVKWDKTMFDINSIAWTKEAYNAQRYAYAADYVRLFAVYNFGGIYLDMDIEVVKNFDNLLDKNTMFAYENKQTKFIEAGCFGAEKGNFFIKKCMEYYEKKEHFMPIVAPEVMEFVLKENKIALDLYSNDYFTAKNQQTGKIETTENTYTIHHFNSDYVPKKSKWARDNIQKIRAKLGENSFTSKILTSFLKIAIIFPIAVWDRIRIGGGIKSSVRYYCKKYILKKIV